MLRVRPIHFTSRPEAWEPLLGALGMIKTVDDDDRREFDAGSGRLALHRVPAGSAEDATTVFGVEIGDPAEFARRTEADGTRAEVIDAPHGTTVRITAQDGFKNTSSPAALTVRLDKTAPSVSWRRRRAGRPRGPASRLAT